MNELITILNGVATVIIAIFTCLTWGVYRQIRNLATRTNEISSAMLDETSKARRERVRPAVLLRERSISGSKDGFCRITVELENVGVGNAYDIRVQCPLRPDGNEERFNLIKPGGIQRTQLEIEGEYRPSVSPGEAPFESPPYDVELRYRDLHGNELETTQIKDRVITIGVDIPRHRADIAAF